MNRAAAVNPKVEAFREELIALCRKHGMVLLPMYDWLAICKLDEEAVRKMISAEDNI